jgi:pimeloyl-ACP methyl ester esterase
MPHNLVFLPGWGFKASVWETIGARFPSHHVMYCDLPALNDRSLSSVIDEIGNHLPDNAVIIGWSLGGMLGAMLCEQYIAKCRSLITVSSSPKFVSDHTWQCVSKTEAAQFTKTFTEDTDQLLKSFRKWVAFPQLTELGYLNQHMIDDKSLLADYLDILMNEDFRRFYQSLTLPVTHIFGGRDAILPADLLTQMRNNYSYADIQTIEGAGHAPFITHSEEFINVVNRFLETSHVTA